MYNFENTKEIMKVNTLKRREILKDLKTEEEEKIDIFKLLEENSKNVTDEEILELKNKLIFEYKFKGLSDIPTKESVTNIVHKNVGKEVNLINEEEPLEAKEDFEEENEITFPKPKFLIGTEEEKISSAKRGTLIHLCMKNLQFGREYNLDDVKELINDLEARKIITDKEKESINPWVILKFTKSNIWKELKEAKEYHKEEPFYINIPANEVIESTLDENILVQGIIDLYYVTKDDELVLLDYKTDFINEGEEKILIDRHKPQLMLYKRALESGINKKVDKIYIYSTKLGKEILI